MVTRQQRISWVVLVHRVPREPSAPRIAIWRRLKALGVGQLADGVVALPEDARTLEHLEWVADRVLTAGGTALLLRAQAMSEADEKAIASRMADARSEEYLALTERARAASAGAGARAGARAGSGSESLVDRAVVKRLRQDLRTIGRRDYFPPAARDQAVAAVRALADAARAPALDVRDEVRS